LGGNNIDPTNPADPGTYMENEVAVQTSPPWEVLGLNTEADLIALADNYYTGGATPPGVMSGITYVKLGDNGGTSNWNPATIDGTGILVVHNDDFDAVMKNVMGTFKGIVISDDMEHINAGAMVIGAMITTNASGNALGLGNANVLYSKAAINATIATLGAPSGLKNEYEITPGTWKET
ncbi:hypothetical protein ACFLQ1_02810, partial [Candidatus Auribacterota bacterium]